jgi:hypothetical protein
MQPGFERGNGGDRPDIVSSETGLLESDSNFLLVSVWRDKRQVTMLAESNAILATLRRSFTHKPADRMRESNVMTGISSILLSFQTPAAWSLGLWGCIYASSIPLHAEVGEGETHLSRIKMIEADVQPLLDLVDDLSSVSERPRAVSDPRDGSTVVEFDGGEGHVGRGSQWMGKGRR